MIARGRSPLDGVRLVALDLDGTLLPASKRLTDRARRVAGDLRDAGIVVTLATGRGWTHAERYARELGIAHPLVTFEGALVATPSSAPDDARGRHVLHHRTLHADLVRRVAQAVADLRLGYFVCTDAGRTVASRHLADRVDQIAIWDPHVDLVDVWLEADARGYILHLIGPPDDVREAYRRMHGLGLEDVEYFHVEFWDGFDQLQIRPHGIGKHVGLRHVLDHLGLTPADVLAAGDWLNDVDMLRMARVSVAPANAVPEIRAIATHVLDRTCDDDAVVRFLEDALRGT